MDEIVDINTLFGPLPAASNDLPVEALLALMQKHGIETACTLSTLGVLLDPALGNSATRAACSENAALLPVATLNPLHYFGDSETAARIRSDGFRMVRFFPGAQEWPVDFGPFRDLVAGLTQANIPVMVDIDQPGVASAVARILDEYPSPVILAGVEAEMLAETISAMRRHPRWFVETSRLLAPGGIQKLADTLGADRILFGSSAPSHPIAAAVNTLKFSGLNDEDRKRVLATNARRLLSL